MIHELNAHQRHVMKKKAVKQGYEIPENRALLSSPMPCVWNLTMTQGDGMHDSPWDYSLLDHLGVSTNLHEFALPRFE